jgi:hypothetical protein
MESTYYNVVAPASYGGLSKIKPKGYTKKEVREWLQSQDTYTLHKPTRRRFPICEISVFFSSEWCISSGPRDQSNLVEHLFLVRLLRMFPILVDWSITGSTFKTEVETTKGAVVNMESTYYNVVAPASYEWPETRLSKSSPSCLSMERPMHIAITRQYMSTSTWRKKSENGYSLRTRTRCISQLGEDFPDVKWSCMELTTSGRRI